AWNEIGRLDTEAIGIQDVVRRLDLRLAVGSPAGLRLPGDDRFDAAQFLEAALGGNRLVEERDGTHLLFRSLLPGRSACQRRLLIPGSGIVSCRCRPPNHSRPRPNDSRPLERGARSRSFE